MKIFHLCKPYILSQKYTLAAYILIILLTTAIGILPPYIIGSFLDNLIEGAGVYIILRFCAVYAGLNLIKIIKGYILSIMYVKMHTQMGYNFNMDTVEHIQGLSLSYAINQDSAYLSQRISGDTNSLIMFCLSILQNIIKNILLLVIPFVILLTMNWFIAAMMIGFLVVYIAIYFLFRKSIYSASLVLKEARNKFTPKLIEQLKHIKFIKINSVQKEINQRANGGFATVKDAALHNQKINYLYSSSDGVVSTVAQITLFIVGGIQILNGNFTIGMFTIFSSYFAMTLGASKYFFSLGAAYQNALVSYNRIAEILEQKQESRGATVINDVNKISLRDVGFSYCIQPAAAPAKAIIKGLNIEFSKGNIYAISGANGTGKSTLTSLIIGMYIDEYKGCITYNGTDIRNIDMEDVRRKHIGFAEQEPVLVNDSIGYNLNIGHKKHRTLEHYIDILNMRDFVSTNGLDFEINDKNTNTSGGEKQKITILRVLYKDPVVMVFDEPTSALDTPTTKKFMEYMQSVKRDKIIIIITHDEAVKGQCDEVYSLA